MSTAPDKTHAAMEEACQSGKILEIAPGSAVTTSFGGRKAVLFFWATWHDGCIPVAAILEALAAANGGSLLFVRIDADAVPKWTEEYGVNAVPTILMVSSKGAVVERLEGGGEDEASNVTLAVQRLLERSDNVGVADETSGTSEAPLAAEVDPKAALKERLDSLVRSDIVMLFMKGKPAEPRCGFSRKAVEFLNSEKIPFSTFDILSDEEVRQGLKEYSNWPTYPQLYVNGELIGGLDIMKELAEESKLEGSEPLAKQWGVTPMNAEPMDLAPPESLDDRLKQLVNRRKIMLFMKGLPSAPKCGFSRTMVSLLDEAQVAYDSFDILSDDTVRQGLKTYSNWPTYPQLYVDGELIGGLDICKELSESGELKELLQG